MRRLYRAMGLGSSGLSIARRHVGNRFVIGTRLVKIGIMDYSGAIRVMETTSFEVANQYIRFGWRMVNQHLIPATDDTPERMNYVLAYLHSLEDTRQLLTLGDTDAVNAHLKLGWRLIEKFVCQSGGGAREESVRFVLAWQSEDPPQFPSDDPVAELEISLRAISDDLV